MCRVECVKWEWKVGNGKWSGKCMKWIKWSSWTWCMYLYFFLISYEPPSQFRIFTFHFFFLSFHLLSYPSLLAVFLIVPIVRVFDVGWSLGNLSLVYPIDMLGHSINTLGTLLDTMLTLNHTYSIASSFLYRWSISVCSSWSEHNFAYLFIFEYVLYSQVILFKCSFNDINAVNVRFIMNACFLLNHKFACIPVILLLAGTGRLAVLDTFTCH